MLSLFHVFKYLPYTADRINNMLHVYRLRLSLSSYLRGIMHVKDEIVTYDHRILKIELPVRSAVLKQYTGGLVVRWVTTGEYPLLYVFEFLFVCEKSIQTWL
jgi:hypothetical protein